MKKFVAAAALLSATIAAVPASAAVTYTYVGSWHVGDGADWPTSPAVLTGQQAAAIIFGGTAVDYAISTKGIDPNNIDFMSFADGYGSGGTNLTTPVSQSFSSDVDGKGYNTFGDISAYVHDNSCFNRYGNLGAKCAASEPGSNYAFRAVNAAVPEPATWAMMILGMGAVGYAMRRRVKVSEVNFTNHVLAIAAS